MPAGGSGLPHRPAGRAAVALELAGRPVAVRRAGPAELGLALGILDEAATWLRARGIEQWPRRFSPTWLEGPLARGEIWLAWCTGTAMATFRLATSDAAWPDDAADARYVHSLAVRRPAAGLGAQLLAWMAATAGQEGGRRLRLDCVAGNLRLRRYYEALGFVHVSDATVHGPPGDRSVEGPSVTVSLYERLLAGRAAGGVDVRRP